MADEPDDNGYVLENQIGHLLRRAHQRATQIFLETFETADLTPTQWAALSKLASETAASQNHLGRMTAMDPATIQGVIRRLEARGLVGRTDDPNDRRRTLLRLTDEGRKMVQDLSATAHKVSEQTLAPLEPEESRALLNTLSKMAGVKSSL
ncbi:MAG: MarR family transcriptional regulator [Alphaproteobacteria bacterium]|nr:MarR family transcriptional regulator [Alphaproteobacteria bacterium]